VRRNATARKWWAVSLGIGIEGSTRELRESGRGGTQDLHNGVKESHSSGAE